MTAFAGKVALVTGGARGIGLEVSTRLAREGASVAIIDIDPAAAEAAASQLPLAPKARAVGIGADVAEAEPVEAGVERVITELGGLDVLVNNAGVLRDNLLFKMSECDWDLVMNVHLRGAFLVTRAAQRHFVTQRSGAIVNVSSVSALGSRGQANYSAAKAGVQGFTRTLAMELGPFGIRANAVAPGFIATEMTDATARRIGMEPDEMRAESAATTPLRRVGDPGDVASVVAFLAGPESAYVTGQIITIDGGQSLGG